MESLEQNIYLCIVHHHVNGYHMYTSPYAVHIVCMTVCTCVCHTWDWKVKEDQEKNEWKGGSNEQDSGRAGPR